jgi:hypothetical protein
MIWIDLCKREAFNRTIVELCSYDALTMQS